MILKGARAAQYIGQCRLKRCFIKAVNAPVLRPYERAFDRLVVFARRLHERPISRHLRQISTTIGCFGRGAGFKIDQQNSLIGLHKTVDLSRQRQFCAVMARQKTANRRFRQSGFGK